MFQSSVQSYLGKLKSLSTTAGGEMSYERIPMRDVDLDDEVKIRTARSNRSSRQSLVGTSKTTEDFKKCTVGIEVDTGK